jgi:hypothetical protein
MSQVPPERFQFVRRILPYTTVAMVVTILYVGWVFFARASTNREIERAANQKAVAEARRTDELYGSGHLTILNFYAVPSVVAKGGSLELCYGVSNATLVKIDPPIEEIKPSLTRCFPVKPPAHSTTYTLTASDDKGNTATQAINVVIR